MAEAGEGIEALFSRVVPLGDFAEPLSGHVESTPEERRRLAELFGIESLESFVFDYTLTPVANDRAHLSGDIHADLTQLCILSLEPVSEHIDESVSVDCWPQQQIGREDAADTQPESIGLPPDPPAPIVNGKIDVGAVAGEILASAINPYPRKEGIEFGWNDPKDEDGVPPGPFAELAKLKAKR